MREILRTNDPILLSFAETLLRDANLAPAVLDANMSALEGSIGAFPRRLLVPPSAWEEAVRVLTEADLGQSIIQDGETS